jgi:adenylosuccinate lyase
MTEKWRPWLRRLSGVDADPVASGGQWPIGRLLRWYMARTGFDPTEYSNPLLERYASREMSYVFSAENKFTTWRKLWIALAECQKELGLAITQPQIDEMRRNVTTIDYARAEELEAKTRHDVMAHIHAFGEICPAAKPIIHLGATSAYVGDNTDLIQIKQGCTILLQRLLRMMKTLRDFALRHRDVATLGFTHFQPAQLVTVGKRASLWLQDLAMDYEAIDSFVKDLPFLGVKGTTGTQASFLSLFDGDHGKVTKLDRMVTEKMGFARLLPVSGQTYTRKIDSRAAQLIGGCAESLHKFANDIRLLQHLKEVEEPFEKSQVGSSAMAYKRNPMRSERLTALCRFILSLVSSPSMTAAEQWFERTLDDSANKRLAVAQLFLSADAVLIIGNNIADGLVVYPQVIDRHIRQELPFMATENIIMAAVKQGGDRQEIHERIRVHSMEAAKVVKMEGRDNDLLDRIAGDPVFRMRRGDIDKLLKVSEFVGRAPEQVAEFIEGTIDPILDKGKEYGSIGDVELKV